MKDTQNFTAQRLPNGVTEITDLSGVHCFLVEGRDKALLIDAMTGLRGLPAFVATLTDLPVEVALTHGHMDHAGGVFEFGRCYIHPADIPMLDGHTLPARVGYVRGQLPPGEAPEASALACIAKSLAFRPSEACRSSTSILYSYHLIFDLLLQHGM